MWVENALEVAKLVVKTVGEIRDARAARSALQSSAMTCGATLVDGARAIPTVPLQRPQDIVWSAIIPGTPIAVYQGGRDIAFVSWPSELQVQCSAVIQPRDGVLGLVHSEAVRIKNRALPEPLRGEIQLWVDRSDSAAIVWRTAVGTVIAQQFVGLSNVSFQYAHGAGHLVMTVPYDLDRLVRMAAVLELALSRPAELREG